MSRYKAYTEYKDSGVEWLRNIPAHWQVLTLKYCIQKIIDNRGRTPPVVDVGIPLLEAKQMSGDAIYSESNFEKYISLEAHADFIRDDVKENDILFVTVGTVGKTNLVPKNAEYVIAQNIVGLRVRPTINPLYFLFYLRSNEIKAEMSAANKDSILDSIKISDFIQSNICIPDLIEQEKIANFLDHETTKIDLLIEKQQGLIALLKEKRQAVISHAVTKGLNPNAPMKDSGVEWLGEVPEHWIVKKLRYLGICQNGINIGAEYFGSGLPFVSYGDVYKNDVLPEEVHGLVNSTESDRLVYSVLAGDVFFTRTSETVEEIGFSSACLSTIENATFAGFLIRFRPEAGVLDVDFSKYYFRNVLLRAYFVQEMNLVTRASLSQDLLKKLSVTLPPLCEQKQIAEHLNKKSSIFARLTANAESAIDLMKERRTALISAAVTGKIDVRDWRPA